VAGTGTRAAASAGVGAGAGAGSGTDIGAGASTGTGTGAGVGAGTYGEYGTLLPVLEDAEDPDGAGDYTHQEKNAVAQHPWRTGQPQRNHQLHD
jgi:hypothetical protein